jgi:hypothetical protein
LHLNACRNHFDEFGSHVHIDLRLLFLLLPGSLRGAERTSIQDQPILAMLKRGTDPDNIPLYVRHHNIAKETDNNQDLDIIAEMAATELQVNTAVAGKRNWLINLIKVSNHTEAQAKWAQESYDGLITSPDQD